ncbi:hypothetical protein GZ204_00770, partial [Dermatophilus congolensis]
MTITPQPPEELTTTYLDAIRAIGNQPRWSAPTITPQGHLHLHCPPGHTRRSIWTATPEQLEHGNPGTPLDIELPGEPLGILTSPHATVALTRRNDDEHRDAVLLPTGKDTTKPHTIAHHISPFAAPTLTNDGRLALCPTGAPGSRRHLARTTTNIHLIERDTHKTGIHHVHLNDNNEHTCTATPHETPWHTLPPGTTLLNTGEQLLAATTTTLTTIPDHPTDSARQWQMPTGRLLWLNLHPHDPETLLVATRSNGHITLHQLHTHTPPAILWKGDIGESLTSASTTEAGLWYVTATADHPTTLHHTPLNTNN